MNNIKGLSEKKRTEIHSMIDGVLDGVYSLGFADGHAQSSVEDNTPLTIKRVAKVGEKILITNSSWAGGEYDNGDILYVTEVRSSGVSANGIEIGITHDEYEVIAESASPPQIIKSANQQRAELIQRAREFVEEHTKKQPADKYFNKPYIELSDSSETCVVENFFINTKKNAVTCLLRGAVTNRILFKGIAKCMPGDIFNEWIGKAIALARALQIDIPEEFMNAVQPDTPTLGHVCGWNGELYRIEKTEGEKFEFTELATGEIYPDVHYQRSTILERLLDDTNAEYSHG